MTLTDQSYTFNFIILTWIFSRFRRCLPAAFCINIVFHDCHVPGWLYHTFDELGETSTRNNTALKFLQRSIEIDPNNGQTWYFLGRYE